MPIEKSEVCILGGGPGGLACAELLALHGKSVVVINDGPLMGYGIQGAFASKAEFEIMRQYVYSSLRPEIYGEVPVPSFKRMSEGTQRAAATLSLRVRERLNRFANVRLIEGPGRFVEPGIVEVGGERVAAENFVIATGSKPRVPGNVTLAPGRVLTSDTVFELADAPKSMLIVGAGVIGCEFACIFAALGCKVQLLDTQPRILGMEDPDVSSFMARAFTRHGVEVIHSGRFSELQHSADGVITQLQDGRELATETVLFAVGRVASTQSLNLEITGVEIDKRGYVQTDGLMRTNVANFFAVGDVGQRSTTLDMALVHVAQAEGRCAAHQMLNETYASKMEHVPYIVFTIPMLAGAGMTETAARQMYGEGVRIGKYAHGRNHRAHANAPPIGFTKLIVGPPGNDRILGVRVVGREADTLAAAASIMIERELPYTYLLDCILPHPSLIECLQGAAHIIDGDTFDYEDGEEFGLESDSGRDH